MFLCIIDKNYHQLSPNTPSYLELCILYVNFEKTYINNTYVNTCYDSLLQLFYQDRSIEGSQQMLNGERRYIVTGLS